MQPRIFRNTSTIDVAMVRPGDVALYPDYLPYAVVGAQPALIYCATAEGLCGASIPLYSYHSNDGLYDHFVDTVSEEEGYSKDFGGKPVCYGWPMPVVVLRTVERWEWL